MGQAYTSAFFAAHHDGALRSARVVVPLVLQFVSARSVVDVGCGQGARLSVFRHHGIEDIQGVDDDYVDRDRLQMPSERFRAHDLTRPLHLGRTFDLAVSLEVAEHLSADVADAFVTSLTRLAPVILFSAAAPYQGGKNHVNERWPAYWAELFALHDFLPVDRIRRRVWANPDVEWWYAQNEFLYIARARLGAAPVLTREYEAAGPVALPLVHPQRYVEWIEWGLGLCRDHPSASARAGVVR